MDYYREAGRVAGLLAKYAASALDSWEWTVTIEGTPLRVTLASCAATACGKHIVRHRWNAEECAVTSAGELRREVEAVAALQRETVDALGAAPADSHTWTADAKFTAPKGAEKGTDK